MCPIHHGDNVSAATTEMEQRIRSRAQVLAYGGGALVKGLVYLRSRISRGAQGEPPGAHLDARAGARHMFSHRGGFGSAYRALLHAPKRPFSGKTGPPSANTSMLV